MKIKRYNVLYNLIKENNYKTFVEIGVAAGDTTAFLLKEFPDLKVYCVDPYEAYEGYGLDRFNSAEELNEKYKIAQERVLSNPRVTFYKEYSEQAVKHFEPESIDLVFIDGNHFYKWVKQDMNLWYPVVRKGGILSGHDFIQRRKWGVKSAVIEFIRAHKIKLNLSKDTVWYFYKWA